METINKAAIHRPIEIVKRARATHDYKVIEAVFKYTALAYECKWTMLLHDRDCRRFLGIVLLQFLSTEKVCDTLNVKQSTFSKSYNTYARRQLAISDSYKRRYYTVIKSVKIHLENKTSYSLA